MFIVTSVLLVDNELSDVRIHTMSFNDLVDAIEYVEQQIDELRDTGDVVNETPVTAHDFDQKRASITIRDDDDEMTYENVFYIALVA
jgi:hypothetical protein